MQNIIDEHFSNIENLSVSNHPPELKKALENVFSLISNGKLSICNKENGEWNVLQWVKKAILLYFKTTCNKPLETTCGMGFDKIPLRFQTKEQLTNCNFRIVPGAIIRNGTYIGKNSIIMPSFINIGAHVGENTMIDTWATVGSCARIGANVHLSGGAGIGGVLEPLQANPTIIEDNCFIGARSEVVEGVIVEENSVISMGVYIGKSTKIYNRLDGTISYGKIKKGSVVVPGSIPSKDGTHNLNCAVIVKQVDAKTRSSTSINEILRQVEPVAIA